MKEQINRYKLILFILLSTAVIIIRSITANKVNEESDSSSERIYIDRLNDAMSTVLSEDSTAIGFYMSNSRHTYNVSDLYMKTYNSTDISYVRYDNIEYWVDYNTNILYYYDVYNRLWYNDDASKINTINMPEELQTVVFSYTSTTIDTKYMVNDVEYIAAIVNNLDMSVVYCFDKNTYDLALILCEEENEYLYMVFDHNKRQIPEYILSSNDGNYEEYVVKAYSHIYEIKQRAKYNNINDNRLVK